jgi:SAM-dependent methyltransferase
MFPSLRPTFQASPLTFSGKFTLSGGKPQPETPVERSKDILDLGRSVPDEQTMGYYRENADQFAAASIKNAVNAPEKSIAIRFEEAYDPLPEDGIIADVGSGVGNGAQILSAVYGYKVHGIEPDPQLRMHAADEYPGLKDQLHEGHLPNNLPAELKGQCDGLLVADTLQHIPTAQMPEAIRNLKGLLKGSGGRILVSMPFGREDLDRKTGRDKSGRLQLEYEPQDFKNYFEAAGFKQIAFYGKNTDPAKRQLERHDYIFELK